MPPPSSAPASPATTSTARLSILGLTDSHGVLLDWDYLTEAPPTPAGSVARVSSLVRRIRETEPHVLLFDVGDSIQGTPLVSLAAREPIGRHPVATALEVLGVDAACLGNHDLDFGTYVLAQYADDCAHPILAANFDGLPGITASTLIDIETTTLGTVRVGVLGLSTPGALVWDARQLAGTATADGIVEAARTAVPRLLEEGAEVVVVLCHSGLGPSSTYGSALPWPENDGRRLIEEIPGIDAVLLGHLHVEVAGHLLGPDGNQVPYVEPASLGLRLGRIDLDLERVDGTVRVVASRVASLPVDSEMPDPEMTAALRTDHERTRSWLNTPVGSADVDVPARPIRFGPSPCVDLVNVVQADAVERALAGTEWEELPVVSASALAYEHDGLRAGTICNRDLYRLSRFDNTLQAVVMTGSQVRDYLEHNARYFGEETLPDFNLDAIGAARHVVGYTVHRDAASGSRIADLQLDGEPVAPDTKIVVALTDYRASGGGGFPHTAGNQIIYSWSGVRETLARWISERGSVGLPDITRSAWVIR